MSDGDGEHPWRNPTLATGAGAAAVARGLTQGAELRRKVAGGLALGTFLIELPNPVTLANLALAGFDFAVLDMEHSGIDFARLETLVSAANACSLPVLVRTWGEDVGLIGKVLDMGAHGIMVPHVESPERARSVVGEARYAPLGGRGFSPLSRFDAIEHPLRDLNESTYVVVQIEGRGGLARAAEIAAVEGLDAVFVGPYDLALSLGVPPGDSRVRQAAVAMAAEAPATVGLGIYMDDPACSGDWAQCGFALQCVSFDGRMLAEGIRSVADRARRSAADSVRAGSRRERHE